MMRLTQDPVEALWRAKTAVRLTQDVVEVLERFVTNVRLTSMCVEVLYQNPDYTPPVPSTATFTQPLCDSDDASVVQDAPPPMSIRSDDSKPMSVRSDQAEVGGS